MSFTTTRGKGKYSAAQAVVAGIADDGGLFVPDDFSAISESEINDMCDMDYIDREAFVMHRFFGDFDYKFLKQACRYRCMRFHNGDPAPVVALCEDEFVVELVNGPSCSMHDVALTVFPLIAAESLRLLGMPIDFAALSLSDGYSAASLAACLEEYGLNSVSIYPESDANDILSMQTTSLECSAAFCAGGFISAPFAERKIYEKVKKKAERILLADSCNIAYIGAQIPVFFSVYCDLLSGGVIKNGEQINIAVADDSTGSLVALLYAKRMGLPVKKIIVASGERKFLYDFLSKGDAAAPADKVSSSTPILENACAATLERLFYEMNGRNCEKTCAFAQEYERTGRFHTDGIKFLAKEFYASYATGDDAYDYCEDYYDDFGYLFDLASAAGVKVATDYFDDTGDITPVVYVSAASPYKTPAAVFYALTGMTAKRTDDAVTRLYDESGIPVPEKIEALPLKKVPKNPPSVDSVEEAAALILKILTE